MSDGLRFTVEEFVKLAQAVGQELASNSEDGKFSLDEAVSGFSRVNNKVSQKSFMDTLGVDVFGKKLESKKVA